MSRTYIKNANRPWIYASSHCFLPKLVELLDMKSVTTLLFLVWLSFPLSLFPTSFSFAMADASKSPTLPDLYEASIAELQDGLENEDFTSVDLIKVHRHPCTRSSNASSIFVRHISREFWRSTTRVLVSMPLSKPTPRGWSKLLLLILNARRKENGVRFMAYRFWSRIILPLCMKKVDTSAFCLEKH